MSARSDPARRLRLAYLTSQYPFTSHTFIAREVFALRALGVQVETFSIRRPLADDLSDPTMREEAARTFTVLARPVVELVSAHVQLLAARPAAYCRTFLLALGHRPPGIKGAALSLAYFAEAILLSRELKRRGTTHLHNHFANSAAIVGFLATRYLGLPWSFTVHGISETDYPAGLMLARKIEAATFVACVSYFGRAQAMRLVRPSFWSKLHIVRCGLQLDVLPPRASQRSGATRFICVGRLSPEKGQIGVLQAFASIAGRTEHLELTLVGDGPNSDELRNTAVRLGLEGRVTFTGRLGELETFEAIARSDILVLPSFMEGLPVVLMEAMAVGTAVVASRVAGIPELVEEGKTGLLFTPSDWNDLARCMSTLAADEDLRTQFAARARERISSGFDIRNSAERLFNLYQRDQ